MDPQAASSAGGDDAPAQHIPVARRQSSSQNSQASDDSHTALDFIRSQMQLEADAREALPYSIENCTKPLGPLRQSVFACVTCNPPPPAASLAADTYDDAAGICYACSVQCHGEHTLVELFNKRNFSCDCGTTRFPDTAPCTRRINPKTNAKGGVTGETPDGDNQYNQNFRNRFCGCALDYDPFQQKGTMFQCLGLGTHKTGGCGEDWWHPGCVVGLGPRWFEKDSGNKAKTETAAEASDALPTISEDAEEEAAAPTGTTTVAAAANNDGSDAGAEEEEPPMPDGFPKEEDFEGFICYKCVDAFPWIKQYAGSAGFLSPVFYKPQEDANAAVRTAAPVAAQTEAGDTTSRKRKAEDDAEDEDSSTKKPRSEVGDGDVKVDTVNESTTSACKRKALPAPLAGQFSLFFTESFRDHLCRCAECFPLLKPHPQLLEEEETYEPPVSDDGSVDGGNDGQGSIDGSGGARSHGSGSLYERGESALRNVDRVRAIEGVMAYNHLKDKLKPFFQQFAESGQAISAEDIKAYFAKLRGDEQAIQEAGEAAKTDHREEQSGY
ncbi:metaphase-anaphase transition protein [Ophiostoma piceae UAMH 11346]|uniref:Metaphase-anaphase transition protein n=1 Tax=Ophiostoma piceae (strain UAMH 11346) TaxID=1262450 RepID=S3C1P9_OPHP1|nr:metaphase-anaphase transition protein [Ophiostoma piceae UAMH 11346]